MHPSQKNEYTEALCCRLPSVAGSPHEMLYPCGVHVLVACAITLVMLLGRVSWVF